jgi:hypothetical protein
VKVFDNDHISPCPPPLVMEPHAGVLIYSNGPRHNPGPRLDYFRVEINGT